MIVCRLCPVRRGTERCPFMGYRAVVQDWQLGDCPNRDFIYIYLPGRALPILFSAQDKPAVAETRSKAQLA